MHNVGIYYIELNALNQDCTHLSAVFLHLIYSFENRLQPGGPAPPNKEQNWENKEQNWGKKFQNGAFWGMVIHENTCCKTKFKS